MAHDADADAKAKPRQETSQTEIPQPGYPPESRDTRKRTHKNAYANEIAGKRHKADVVTHDRAEKPDTTAVGKTGVAPAIISPDAHPKKNSGRGSISCLSSLAPPSNEQNDTAIAFEDEELTLEDLPEACRALKLKLERDKHGHRQYGRRLKCEPFRLSASQKNLMATSYKAARQCDTTVDYLRMARSRHFATFKGHAKKLEALEQSLVREMKEALREQRRLDANIKEKTKKDWQEELSHCKVLHHQTEAELKKKIIHLEERDVVRLASVTELQNELQSVKHDFKQLQESQPAKTETSLSHAELVVLKASLDKQREDQQKSRSDLTELAAKLSAKQKELEEEKTSLATKAADQLEEGLRLQTQMKLNKKMEHSVRMAFDEERAKDSAENEIWRDEREAMTMELNRAIRALQGQIAFNECSEAAKRWKYISDEYNQQKEEALEECAANRRRKDQLRFELEKAKETIVELERESAEFKLKLYSYRLCGITEKRIQLFAGRYSTNPDNIVSRNKQRQFAVNLMQSCSDDEAKQLDEDITYFVQTRNVLCHDGDGNKAFEVDHRKLQYCCRSINSALVGLQAFMCNK